MQQPRSPASPEASKAPSRLASEALVGPKPPSRLAPASPSAAKPPPRLVPEALDGPKPPSPLAASLRQPSKSPFQTQASKQDRILAWVQAEADPQGMGVGGSGKEPQADDWRSRASSAELYEGGPDPNEDLVLRSASMQEQEDLWVSGLAAPRAIEVDPRDLYLDRPKLCIAVVIGAARAHRM